MTSQHYTLKAQDRIAGGKLRNAREKGLMPAVIYGNKFESISIFLNTKDFQKTYKTAGNSSVIDIEVGGSSHTVLVQEVAHDARFGFPIHVDFLVVKKGQVVKVSIPVEYIGEAPGEKIFGATLVKLLHDIEVEGTPSSLPNNIEVDIATLVDLGSRITVADLKLPKNISIHLDPETVVATLSAKQEESQNETEGLGASAEIAE